jgi:hypothetical protein
MKGKFHQLWHLVWCNLTTSVLPHWAVSCCSTLPHRQRRPSALHSTTLPHSVLSLHLHVAMQHGLTLRTDARTDIMARAC